MRPSTSESGHALPLITASEPCGANRWAHEAMKNTHAAVIERSGFWWIGWIGEVTEAELLETLRMTLREALAFNRQEALEAAGDGFEDRSVST